MTDLRKAAEMALEALEMLDRRGGLGLDVHEYIRTKIKALRQALAQSDQEPVTLLPDGSAFGVMSFPLPDSHWLYAEREYRDGEHEPIELGKPILTHELRDAVVSAVRYAIRGATNCGKEMDFDPDALVQNAVYALCGPYTRHVDAVNISAERVDETAKREHEPYPKGDVVGPCICGSWPGGECLKCKRIEPPKREWVGLTPDDIHDAFNYVEMVKLLDFDRDRPAWCEAFASACEARLKHKNGGNK